MSRSAADKMRRAAMEEILRPTLAYDEIRADGEHPLESSLHPDHFVEYLLDRQRRDPSPYFEELAERCRELLRNPTGASEANFVRRCRISNIVGE
jgi:hypothetical protein